jgi:hypothetical protein
MTRNNIIIASLALDLKRVALGFYNGSDKTAKRFSKEALKRKDEIEEKEVKHYLGKMLRKLPGILRQKDKMKLAEDALMYSTIFQNYALKF